MRPTPASFDGGIPRGQLHHLSVLLDEALAESNALHHRIREIQLRIAELSASLEAGRLAPVVRTNG